jgi:hypothetical protein
MDHKTLSRKLTIEQATRISKTSEKKLKYHVNHDSERSYIYVRVSILPLSTNFEDRIVMLELFMLFLLLPYFYLCIYLLYLFILFLMLVILVHSLMSLRFVLLVQSLVFCSVFHYLFCCLFVLSVILRLTTSDYNLGISKLFLQ